MLYINIAHGVSNVVAATSIEEEAGCRGIRYSAFRSRFYSQYCGNCDSQNLTLGHKLIQSTTNVIFPQQGLDRPGVSDFTVFEVATFSMS